MNACLLSVTGAALLLLGCAPEPEVASPWPEMMQSVRGHHEISVEPDGNAVPWFIGADVKTGVCVTPSVLVDTSRWRVSIDANQHAPTPSFEAPSARNSATLCADRTLQQRNEPIEALCVSIVDDYDGTTHRLACQRIRHSAHDAIFSQLATRRSVLLKESASNGVAQRFLALAEVASAQQRPITALRLTLIAAHFERRDAEEDGPWDAAQKLNAPPLWLTDDAANAIAGQYHYEQAMNALRRNELTGAWRSAVAAHARFGAVAHPKTIVAATRRAQVLLRSGAAGEARVDLARAIEQCRQSVCEAALLRDANNTLAWWLLNDDDSTPDDLARADILLADALLGTTGVERANVLLNRAYLQTQTAHSPVTLLGEAGALLNGLGGDRAQQLRRWRTFIMARDAYVTGDLQRALTLIRELVDHSNSGALAARTQSLRGHLLRDAGRLQEAQAAFTKAVELHAQLRPLTQWIPVSPGQRASDYYALALTAVDQGQPGVAWKTLQALDELADAQHCPKIEDTPTQHRLDALARTLHELEGPASAQRETQRELVRVELNLTQRALARQRRGCNSGVAAATDAADLRAFAYADELVLLQRADDTAVRVARRTRFTAFTLREQVERLDQYLGDSEINDRAWREASAALAAALLPDADTVRPAFTRFALHGQLQRIPLSALPYAAGWFADATTVILMPAGSRVPARQTERVAHGVVVIDPSGDFGSGANATDFFASAFPAATLLQGSAARVDAVTEAIPHARWLHVGAHGEADEHFPDLFALRMADGLLFSPALLRDVSGLVFANLSSCRSGRFSLTADSGQWGLAGGLVRAGVPWVIAARHDLQDRAADRFNRAFYTHYQRTGSVLDAYRLAHRQLRKALPARIWSALMLVGDGGGQSAAALTPYPIAQPFRPQKTRLYPSAQTR